MADDETSIGVWVSGRQQSEHAFDLDVLEEFDDWTQRSSWGSDHRSDHMKNAMFLYLRVLQQFDRLEQWDVPEDERELARFVTGAMKDAYEQDVRDR